VLGHGRASHRPSLFRRIVGDPPLVVEGRAALVIKSLGRAELIATIRALPSPMTCSMRRETCLVEAAYVLRRPIKPPDPQPPLLHFCQCASSVVPPWPWEATMTFSRSVSHGGQSYRLRRARSQQRSCSSANVVP